MRLKTGVLALLLVLSATASSQAATCTLADLRFMAASWHSADTPERAQERWVVAPDDVLMGSAWEFPAGKNGFAEVMTIRKDGEVLSMLLRHFDNALKRAWEEREAPMVFTAARCEANAAVFDGQGAHAGEHLTYRRSGDNLLIIGDFLHQGAPVQLKWHMVRAAD
jgi:hypothetical protein